MLVKKIIVVGVFVLRSILKLTPVVLIAGLMMSGLDILLAAPISFAYAVVIAMIT